MYSLNRKSLLEKSEDIKAIEKLYNGMINCWNNSNADKFAGHFSTEGTIIDFDGTAANGKVEIEEYLNGVLMKHEPLFHTTIIRSIRFITDDVCILETAVGTFFHDKEDIDPSLNIVQTVIVKKKNNSWLIEQLQNTPAVFHGHPELSAKLTEEIRNEYLERSS
ncbi:MAG: SgcJ/EcaC family oxidoreductase [Clostridiaceae bacterium]